MSAVLPFLNGLPDHMPAAPCSEYPTAFVDASRRTPLKVDVENAKRLCGRCPVKAACLDYAVTNGETDGVWGGLTPDERDEYARENRELQP